MNAPATSAIPVAVQPQMVNPPAHPAVTPVSRGGVGGMCNGRNAITVARLEMAMIMRRAALARKGK